MHISSHHGVRSQRLASLQTCGAWFHVCCLAFPGSEGWPSSAGFTRQRGLPQGVFYTPEEGRQLAALRPWQARRRATTVLSW